MSVDQALHDRHRIVETIIELFVATDERDWPRVEGCFALEVWFDMSSLSGAEPTMLTPSEITAMWEEGLRPIAAIHHQAGNFRVALGGDVADATCYATAMHFIPNASGRNTRTFVGSYDFHLARAGSEWRIDRFRFDLKFIDGNLELERSG